MAPTVFFCRSCKPRLVCAARASPASAPMSTEASAASACDFTVKDATGGSVALDKYKGKVTLIVNVASQCGLTQSNYTELTQLQNKFAGKAFEILAFPCNQFGGQEPAPAAQVCTFAGKFGAKFPIFEKVFAPCDARRYLCVYGDDCKCSAASGMRGVRLFLGSDNPRSISAGGGERPRNGAALPGSDLLPFILLHCRHSLRI